MRTETHSAILKDQNTVVKTAKCALATVPFTLLDGSQALYNLQPSHQIGIRHQDSWFSINMSERKRDVNHKAINGECKVMSSTPSASVKKSHQSKCSNVQMKVKNANAMESTSLPSKPLTTVLNSHSKKLTSLVNSSS